MKRTALIIALAAAPAVAQDKEDGGLSLMERGAQLFLEGLMQEAEPAIRELEGLMEELGPTIRQFSQEMGPAFRELMEEVEDWSVYHPPEILPNGDIIIRRKSEDELSAPEEGQIDI